MRATRVFSAVDSHTEGMPTRVITGGVGTLPGDTMFDRKRYVEEKADDLRTLLMYEPRGHAAMSGAILQPPARDDADWGVVFVEVSGCLPMCGHGTIGVATVLVETGMVAVTEPVTRIRLDTPAGLVEVDVEVDGGHARAVTLQNVPAFVLAEALTVDAGEELGKLTYDMVFGGNFYAILPAGALGVPLELHSAQELIRRGMRLLEAIDAHARPAHPTNPEIATCHHVLVTAAGGDGADGRNTVVIHPGWLDRSPCGTGTSARMALLHHRGELGIGEPFVHESIIGSRFTGTLVAETEVGGLPAVVPTITGRAWITGMGQYLLDPDDPFPGGFLVPTH